MKLFLDTQWVEKPFTIPIDKAQRARLLARMVKVHSSDAARLPEHRQAKRVLLARIISLRAYDSVES